MLCSVKQGTSMKRDDVYRLKSASQEPRFIHIHSYLYTDYTVYRGPCANRVQTARPLSYL